MSITHQAHKITSENLLYVVLRIAAREKMSGEVDEVGRRCHATHTAVTVKVGADAHMVNTHDVDGMVEMGKQVHHGGLAFRAQETMISRHLTHSPTLGKGFHLFICEVAGMVAQCAAAAMAAYYGLAAYLHGIPETLLCGMTEVNQNAKAVHLADYLRPKLTDTAMSVGGAATVAQVIVAIMAKGDIYDATTREILHITDVALKSQSILDAKHYGLLAQALVGPQLIGSASKGKTMTVGIHYIPNLVEDKVGIGFRTADIKCHLVTE